MKTVENLPERLRQLRLQQELSQENMADMLGISTTAYGDIERGRTELTISRLEKIAQVLGVSLPDLLGLSATTLTETEWLRRENQRLNLENSRLRQALDQWQRKFQEWVAAALVRNAQESRERIGFK
ncbi:helix-turn-helix domain-containing protein [Telluribacter sp. SYSU D00476]|uniref:helix-turn-helix domain-containing protein n=1 Tax=Telluribacter sp. SYSU D00476 TaxID=2811430 RepID=UPI001FF62358|nr:helix-turn-helix transcriptional regulator [Telluribacter sp. SYSU D00476]